MSSYRGKVKEGYIAEVINNSRKGNQAEAYRQAWVEYNGLEAPILITDTEFAEAAERAEKHPEMIPTVDKNSWFFKKIKCGHLYNIDRKKKHNLAANSYLFVKLHDFNYGTLWLAFTMNAFFKITKRTRNNERLIIKKNFFVDLFD